MTEVHQQLSEKYEMLSVLNEDGTTTLIKDRCSHTVCVKKVISAEQTPVYQTIKENPHIGIPRVLELLEDEQYAIVIEEYISGQTVEQLLQQQGTLSRPIAKKYISDLCDILSHVHQHNIVHRDITAANVMVSEDGVVKLVDFGISRIPKSNQRRDTTILGTQGYASPEQFGFSQTDRRADVYAVGVLLNVMLTGKLPNEQLYKGKLSSIIKRCIAIDPQQRYRSIKQLKSALVGELNEDSTCMMRFIRSLPGYRSLTPWKMVVGSIFYMLNIICAPVYLLIMMISPLDAIITLAVNTIVIWTPIVLCTNMWDIWGRWRWLRCKPWWGKSMFAVFAVVVSWCIAGVLVLFLPYK